jgi:hypothetical protein
MLFLFLVNYRFKLRSVSFPKNGSDLQPINLDYDIGLKLLPFRPLFALWQGYGHHGSN